MPDTNSPYGGAFLVEEAAPEQVLAPEDLPAEARLMARTAEEFVRKQVLPLTERIEAHEEGLLRCLMQQAGELGLLATNVPEAYGGLNLSKSAATLLTEKLAANASFAITVGAHCGIATFPLLFFGTAEQRRKYLPRLATGEMIGAFCLSEAGSGSDALAARARATLSPNGSHYLLNGAKMWTTNGRIADLYTIFAKVDGEQFTAFLVERNTPGLSVGREEHKLGLRGSSTCRVILEDARVPAENVLGEIGKGHRVALYPLNLGRFQIGAGALGATKEALRTATAYALQRSQFGRPIAEFGLVQHKLAEMAVRIFALESAVYRIAGYWDVRFDGIDPDAPDANERYRSAAEEYAVECAIIKVFGSETLDYVVDEALQIHGGYGYTEEFPMARAYRDARINRIFEGTNEINRLAMIDQIGRRARQGRIPLQQAVARLKETILSPPRATADDARGPLELAGEWVAAIRNATLFVAGQAWEALGDRLAERQEVVAALADMTADLFVLESAWLRARKQRAGGQNAQAPLAAQIVEVFGADACARAEACGRYALSGIAAGDTLRAHAATLRHLLKPPLQDTIALRREIAASVASAGGYPCV